MGQYRPHLSQISWKEERVNGTADAGGSVTTTVDTEREEADDFWNDMYIEYKTGSNAGERRLITDFVAASDTITHDAFDNATSAGDTYFISEFNQTPTQGAQTKVFGLLTEDVPFPDPDVNYDCYAVIGGDRDINACDELEIVCESSIPMILQNGELLAMLMGTCTTTGSDPYTHTITGADVLNSMVIEGVLNDGSSDFVRYARGTKINKGTLEAAEKERLKFSMDIITAKTEKTSNTKSSITLLTTKPYFFYQGALTLWGTTFARLKSFSLSIDNMLSPEWYIQSSNAQYAYEINAQERAYEIKATIIVTDTTIFDKIGVDTAFDIDLTFTRTAASDTLQIKNPTAKKCYLKSAPHILPATGGNIPVELTIIPRGIEFVVVDAISAYPCE